MAKSKYDEWLQPDGLLRLAAYARDGLIEDQIAHNMGISRSTLFEWKKKYPSISDALSKSKEIVDFEVENSLNKIANGYRYNEITRERMPIKDQDGIIIDYELVITKVIEKEVQPNATAQIFWLKNRKPKEWRDKQDVEMTGKDGKDFEIKLIGV